MGAIVSYASTSSLKLISFQWVEMNANFFHSWVGGGVLMTRVVPGKEGKLKNLQWKSDRFSRLLYTELWLACLPCHCCWPAQFGCMDQGITLLLSFGCKLLCKSCAEKWHINTVVGLVG